MAVWDSSFINSDDKPPRFAKAISNDLLNDSKSDEALINAATGEMIEGGLVARPEKFILELKRSAQRLFAHSVSRILGNRCGHLSSLRDSPEAPHHGTSPQCSVSLSGAFLKSQKVPPSEDHHRHCAGVRSAIHKPYALEELEKVLQETIDS